MCRLCKVCVHIDCRKKFALNAEYVCIVRYPPPVSPTLRILHKSEWISDELRSNCQQCKTSFGVVTRKHHCRLCGEVHCEDCAPHRAETCLMSKLELKRVCPSCFKRVCDEIPASHRPKSAHDSAPAVDPAPNENSKRNHDLPPNDWALQRAPHVIKFGYNVCRYFGMYVSFAFTLARLVDGCFHNVLCVFFVQNLFT
jgi:hypothetical protein